MKNLLLTAQAGLGEAGLTALIGIGVILAVLAVLMLFVKIMSGITDKMLGQESANTVKTPPQASHQQNNFIPKESYSQPTPQQEELTLIDVSESDAAVIMAIVAQNCGLPLEKLRFKSIKKIGEEK